MIHITEDKLKAAIQICLGGDGIYTEEREAKLVHDIKALSIADVMHHVCPDCEGRKYFPDKKSTSGQKPCNRCWGTGQIVP